MNEIARRITLKWQYLGLLDEQIAELRQERQRVADTLSGMEDMVREQANETAAAMREALEKGGLTLDE